MMNLENNTVIKKVIDGYSPGSVALALTGSFARGTPSPHSDLDIIRYVTSAELDTLISYQLLIIDEQLVSLTHTSIESVAADLHQPSRFYYVKPSLQQCVILYDPHGQLERLKDTAGNIDWSNLAGQAELTISTSLAGLVEEITKILTGLLNGQPWTCIYAIQGLLIGLCELMIIHHQAYLLSENQFFLVPQQVAGIDSYWSKNFRVASGVLIGSNDDDNVAQRSRAALSLYADTCRIMGSSINETDRRVITWGLKQIESYFESSR